jgi:hypothetical protein
MGVAALMVWGALGCGDGSGDEPIATNSAGGHHATGSGGNVGGAGAASAGAGGAPSGGAPAHGGAGGSPSVVNIIPDPSMEHGTQYWKPQDANSDVVPTPSHTSTGSIELVNDGTGNQATSTNHNILQAEIPGVVAGQEYVYSVWVHGVGVQGVGSGGKPLSVLRWRDAAGDKIIEELYMWAPYGSYDWTELSIHLQAPSEAAMIDAGFRSWWDCLAGTTYWDDSSLLPRQFPDRGAAQGSYQAEDGVISNGSIHADEPEYTGTGFVRPNDGGWVQWSDVSGGAQGGTRIISLRYAHEGNVKDWELSINGASLGTVRPVATGRLSSWATHDWEVELEPGDNTVRLTAIDYTAGPLFDRIDVYAKAGD